MSATTTTNFGTDTSCLTSLRTGRLVSGPRLVAEACFRRLSTPRGSLIGGEDEADYGLDLADRIGGATTPSAVAALPGQLQSELQKDERVDSVTVVVTSFVEGPATTWNVAIAGETADGPFSLELAVADVTVEILGILPES